MLANCLLGKVPLEAKLCTAPTNMTQSMPALFKDQRRRDNDDNDNDNNDFVGSKNRNTSKPCNWYLKEGEMKVKMEVEMNVEMKVQTERESGGSCEGSRPPHATFDN